MLRIPHPRPAWRHEVVWFADGEYDPGRFAADSTYFRQHRLALPAEIVVWNEPFDTLHLDLTRDLDPLLGHTSSTVRRHIRPSSREHICVRTDESQASVLLLIARQTEFNRRKHLGEPPSRALFVRHQGHYLLYSVHQGEVWLGHDRTLVGYASRAMMWHSFCDTKGRGMSVYDFGGILRDETHPAYGVTFFKEAFGGEHVREWNSLVIPCAARRALYRLFR